MVRTLVCDNSFSLLLNMHDNLLIKTQKHYNNYNHISSDSGLYFGKVEASITDKIRDIAFVSEE